MDFEKQLDTAKKAAKRSGEIQMEHFGNTHTFDYKSEKDFATEVDYECEAAIMDIIKDSFPDDGLLGEEDGITEGTTNYIWIIDPLDGTVNYAHGFPHFCTIIGLWNKEKKETVLGVVYMPLEQKMYWATKGIGAFMNDEPIHVSGRKKLKECFISLGSYDTDTTKSREDFDRYKSINENIDRFLRSRITGSAGVDLAFIAEGISDIHVVHLTNPWDHLGPALIIEEAGGKSVDRYLNPLGFESRGIIATNGHVFDELEELIA